MRLVPDRTHRVPFNRRGFLLLLSVMSAGMSVGCGGGHLGRDAGGEHPRLHERMPEAVFADLEERLLGPGPREMEFTVVGEGAFTVSLAGELRVGDRNAASLNAEGSLGPDTVSVWLEATEEGMTWGTLEESFQAGAPAELREALVIGLTRMGVLHTLSRLASGLPPHTDGSVRSSVEVEELEWRQAQPSSRQYPLSFRARVDGEFVGYVVVWLDSEGQIVRRHQIVASPRGDMLVEEAYRWR